MNEKTENEVVHLTQKEYDSLIEDSKFLQCLEGAGVDNWEGYDYAQELFSESVDK